MHKHIFAMMVVKNCKCFPKGWVMFESDMGDQAPPEGTLLNLTLEMVAVEISRVDKIFKTCFTISVHEEIATHGKRFFG